MAILPLEKLNATYAIQPSGQQMIRFSWKWPETCLDHVFFALASDRNNAYDDNTVTRVTVRNCPDGKYDYIMDRITATQVEKKQFVVFMVDGDGVPRNCTFDERFRCSVILGKADIKYSIKRPLFSIGNQSMILASLCIQSSKMIAANVVGYMINYGESEVCFPLPAINKNKKTVITLHIPKNSMLSIKAMEKQYEANIVIKQ